MLQVYRFLLLVQIALGFVGLAGFWFPIFSKKGGKRHVLSPLGLYVGLKELRYARRPKASRMSLWYENMGAMIGGGIGFHTAFLVSG